MTRRLRHLIIPLLGLLLPADGHGLSFPLPAPGDDLIGEIINIDAVYEDTFSDIGRIYDLGYEELRAANPDVDPWLPGAGTRITLPTRFILPPGPREGVVINLPELRLYYYPKGEQRVITHPLGIGREGWSTPTGQSSVTGKTHKPSWRPPQSIREEHAAMGDPLPEVVEPGPGNPLGEYAIYLSMSGYLLHGTNKPYGVGMRVSHGCIRLYPEDIESLFGRLPVGTPVRIVDEPFKAGWSRGRLYVEAHPPLSEQLEARGHNFTPIVTAVVQALEAHQGAQPDWGEVKSAAADQAGFPIPVGVIRENGNGTRSRE